MRFQSGFANKLGAISTPGYFIFLAQPKPSANVP
jgi:hypothetical protein